MRTSLHAFDARRLLLPATLVVLIVLAWMGTIGSPLRELSLDARAQQYVDEGFKRALATFAAARSVNAVLSTVQGTSIAIEPLGIGVQLSVGQALHPLNQIVGQFADWMLAASVAFGVMEVLVRIGCSGPVTTALTAAAGFWLWCRATRRPPQCWLVRTTLVLVLVRFAVPVASIGSQWAYAAFLAHDYAESQAAISASAQRVNEDASAAAEPAKAPSGILDWGSKLLSLRNPDAKPEPGLVDKLKSATTERIKALANAAESLTEHVVRLTVVFLLQTLAIPLLMLWVFAKVATALFGAALHRSTATLPDPGRRLG